MFTDKFLAMIPVDKRLHLIGGLLFAAGAVLVLLLARYAGPGYAVGLASVGMGYGVERYQALRHEGDPSNADWMASCLPGLLIGAAIQIGWTWFGLARVFS